jgi:hypothetical protein
MRKETIEHTYYQFDELTESAKEKARDWYREGGLDYEWWDSTYEDAKTIGLEITSFDFDRRGVEGNFIAGAEETAHKIEKEHGEKCETFIDAKAYLVQRDAIVNQAEKDENGDFVDEYGLDNALDDIDKEFLHTLCEDYRIILQKEMEYLLSDESVDESICANEYEFTENGKREE